MNQQLRRFLAVLVIAALAALPASSYVPQYTRVDGVPAFDRWDFAAFPVQWNMNPSRGANVTGNRSLADVVAASFATWSAAPNAAISVTRGLDSAATSAGFDNDSSANTNLVCFVCTGDFSSEEETLAITITTISNGPGGTNGHGGRSSFGGQILDSDILFNPKRNFSTDQAGSSIDDIQTVLTHEVGHFLGLDHSGVVRAVMFAYAPPDLRTLSYDDVAAVSLVYPKAVPDVPTGAITGSVRHAAGNAVFGAHVFAESVSAAHPWASRNIRKTPIGALTAPDGAFRIDELPPDSYVITAEPLDLPTENQNIEDYAKSFGQAAVQTNFTTRWY